MKRSLLFNIAILIAFNSFSQTVWKPIQNIDPAAGDDPYVIASGDLDGDTNIDIAIGTYSFTVDNVIKWYKNDGAGNFTLQSTVSTVGTISEIGGLAIADLDGINGNDIIAGSYTNDTVIWYPNNGTGGFGAGQVISNDVGGAGQVTVTDINNDGNLDVSAAAYDGNEAVWFAGNGDGTFGTKQVIASVIMPGNVTFEDFDLDGDLDALIGYIDGATGGTIEIYYNQYVESGTMTVSWIKDTVTVNSGNLFLFVAAFADVNDDGVLDIIKTDLNSGDVAWYSKTKNGVSTETIISDATIIARPAVALVTDLDNDGYNDVILTDAGADDDAIIWFESTDVGTFNTEALIADNNHQMYGITVADFDNDGDKDIASIGYFSNTVDWFENALETLSANTNDIKIVNIYPNPTKDVLNFEGFNSASIEVTIFDILGKNVLTKSLNTNETLDVSQLVSGIYSISVNGTFASKFIKE